MMAGGWFEQLEFIVVCLLSILVGMMMVVQAILNGTLSAHFGVPIWGSVVNFGTALGLLTLIVPVEMNYVNARVVIPSENEAVPEKLPFLLLSKRPPWYLLVAGVIGLAYVTCSLILIGYIGTALFFLPSVVGQIICSSFIDVVGIDKPEPSPLTARRCLVICSTLAGAVLTVFGKIKHSVSTMTISVGAMIGCVIVSLVIGFIIPFQAVLNRRVTAQLVHGSKLQATWWSFCEGFVMSLFVLTIQLCLAPKQARAFPSRYEDSRWYMWLGAPLGLLYVFSGILFTGIIGFESYFVSLVTGQLICSLIVESIGVLTVSKENVGIFPIVGVVLVIVTVVGNAVIPKKYDFALQQRF